MEIPNSVTKIGDGAFGGCYNINSFSGKFATEDHLCLIVDGVLKASAPIGLTTIYKIPSSVTKIGKCAFYDCGRMTSVDIPNTVSEIGEGAFYYCFSLTSVEIPFSVTSIGNYAFASCTSLTEITSLNPTPPTVCKYTFDNTEKSTCVLKVPTESVDAYKSAEYWNEFVNIVGIETEDKPKNVIYYTSDDGKLVIPRFPEAFDANIVSNNFEDGIGKITFDGDVTSIGEKAFNLCYNLKTVTIPNSVTSIGDEAFWNCYKLTSVEIPNSVTSIGDEAFSFCSSLTSVEIPNSVTSIGDGAFSYCSNLTSVEIPNSITKIEDKLFWQCTSLKSVEIPNSVTSIGDEAFYRCESMTSVEIPNSVTSIGWQAFEYCTNLKEITSLNQTPPTVYVSTFYGVDKSNCVLKVPSMSVEAYKSADYWNEFFNIEGITDTGINTATIDGVQDGKNFNLQGQPVGAAFKGIVIRGGKKYIQK